MQNHLNGGWCLWTRYLCTTSSWRFRLNCAINSQSSGKRLGPWLDRSIEPRQCSTRISMLCIILRAVWFGQITRRSWKIHRMDFSRVSLLLFWRMAHRWNLWSRSSGSGGTAIFIYFYRKFLSWSTHGNFLSFCGRTRQRCFEIADSRLYKAEFGTSPCQQALRLLTSSSWFGRRPPTTARQDLLALPNANGVEACDGILSDWRGLIYTR